MVTETEANLWEQSSESFLPTIGQDFPIEVEKLALKVESPNEAGVPPLDLSEEDGFKYGLFLLHLMNGPEWDSLPEKERQETVIQLRGLVRQMSDASPDSRPATESDWPLFMEILVKVGYWEIIPHKVTNKEVEDERTHKKKR